MCQEEARMSEHRILRLPAVKVKTGLGRSSIYEFVAAGRFPPPIQLGGHSVGWVAEEIDQWIASRIAASRPPSTAAAA